MNNTPINEEIHFITAYLEKVFVEIENTDLEKKTDEERQAIFATIVSVKSAITDLLSPDGGNYYKLLTALNRKINFETRLSSIIENLSIQTFKKNNKGRVFSISINALHKISYGYKTFELNDYLNNLLLISPIADDEIESQIKKSDENIKPFMHLYNFLEYLAIKYTKQQSLINNKNTKIPVIFFLRDTLLLYLGAKQLQSKGVQIDARAVLINRKLIHSFTPNEKYNIIYKKLYNLIFLLLNTYQGRFSIEFIEQFNKSFRRYMSNPEIQLLKFISKYVGGVLGNKNKFIAVDTAAHGTMPLLTHVATGCLHSLEMFTSSPWLNNFYASNIFANSFSDMRTLESLACQEELFEFAYISKGKVYINETCDQLVLSKAKFEIGFFLNLVDKYKPLV